ncbi:MAG TPA: radical SAM family heme chaperone HemW [Anaerolineae bacterium]|nr:radical SAM family heme chaperone HemW [Anaerolineae bacterium]
MNSQEKKIEARTALFVYIPYCPTICTYCDFNVYARREGEFEAYINAVTREIELVAEHIPNPRLAKTLAFGGGTPSILTASSIEMIVNAVRERFEFPPNAEWTLEANPGTVNLEKLRAFHEMGFTRLSLGVQTFDDARLRAFNRNHTTAESYDAFALARRAGFGNLNLDLIYGLPDQTLEEWCITLDRALALQSEHLSLYGLQVEDGTILKKQIEQGRVHSPNSELAAEMYELAVEKLASAGFVHYEISNWARLGFESQHNKTYWLNEPYLGFGAGAHSSWQGTRYENVKHPREYIRRLEVRNSPIAAREEILREMQMSETIFLGLRLAEGVSWARFHERFAVDAREVYREPIALLKGSGLLQTDDMRMWLTESGMLVSNQILWRFLP